MRTSPRLDLSIFVVEWRSQVLNVTPFMTPQQRLYAEQ